MSQSMTVGLLPQLADSILSRVAWRIAVRPPLGSGSASCSSCCPMASDGRSGRPGAEPAAEIHIHDRRALVKLLIGGETGGGEAYMDGLWSSPDLAGLLRWAALNRDRWRCRPAGSGARPSSRRTIAHRLRRNTKRQSRRNIAAHYDLGNDFYRTFLDETMTYSSAVFASPDQSLADAQRNKYRLMAEGAASSVASTCSRSGPAGAASPCMPRASSAAG